MAIYPYLLRYRQVAIINRALKTPETIFYVESRRRAHSVTNDTARTDLLKLVEMGFLEKTTIGRAFAFNAIKDLKRKFEILK